MFSQPHRFITQIINFETPFKDSGLAGLMQPGTLTPLVSVQSLLAITSVIYSHVSQTQDTLQLEGLPTRAFYGESGLTWLKIE